MQFLNSSTAKISGTLSGKTSRISIDGTTTETTPTPEEAKTQVDKILDIVGMSILTTGMTRTITQEAQND